MYGTKEVDLGRKGVFTVRKGALHRKLGIPEDETIPVTRLDSALKSGDPEERKEAASAKGFRAMKH